MRAASIPNLTRISREPGWWHFGIRDSCRGDSRRPCVIVVDTNVIAYLYLPNEHTQMAEQLLDLVGDNAMVDQAGAATRQPRSAAS